MRPLTSLEQTTIFLAEMLQERLENMKSLDEWMLERKGETIRFARLPDQPLETNMDGIEQVLDSMPSRPMGDVLRDYAPPEEIGLVEHVFDESSKRISSDMDAALYQPPEERKVV